MILKGYNARKYNTKTLALQVDVNSRQQNASCHLMKFPEESWNAIKVFANVWRSFPPSAAALKSGKDRASTAQNNGFFAP